ncbi:MAG: Hsp70 family protein [Syntrophomonadaceae bacterium]|jgi:molecular chaperone DnaK|nr:Hsp70 family protein [Syntrophomonadaceae bacterium]
MHLGIDFGTSYTKLGYMDQGNFINLVGEENQIPTLVVYLPSREKLFFGKMAMRLNQPGAEEVRFFKLEMKRNPDFRLGPFTLNDILREYFNYLRDEYVEVWRGELESITVSVPNYFGLKPRKMLLEAVRQSFGLSEVYLLPEPVAALLGYNAIHAQEQLEGDILCVDIGGGTTDFSFLSMTHKHNEIVMESQFQIGHDAFSGSELDRGVLRFILNPLFKMQHGYDIPAPITSEKNLQGEERYWFNRLMVTAEQVKVAIGRQSSAYFNIPGFYQQDSLVFDLPAELFMAQLEPVFTRLKKYINERVREKGELLGFSREGRFILDYLLLLGGASQTRGVNQLIADICPGPEIIHPQDLSFNVVRGLSQWKQAGSSSFLRVKTIYPFNFFIEKWNPVGTGTILEKLPFDTENLELDINGRHKIFTVPVASPYNLATNTNSLKLRVHELDSADLQAQVEQFMGQDLVLQVDDEEIEQDLVDLYLNLGASTMEVGKDNNKLNSAVNEKQLFPNLLSHQETALDLIRLYPDTNPRLLQDFEEYLDQFSSQPSSDYSVLLMYKLLAFLQLMG